MHHCNTIPSATSPDAPRTSSIGFRRQPGHALLIGERRVTLIDVTARGVTLDIDGIKKELPWESAHTLAPYVTLTATPLVRNGRTRNGRAQLRVTAPPDVRVMRAEVDGDGAEDAEG